MKKRNFLLTTVVSLSLLASPMHINAEGNPYGGGWSNCTWGAWEALYERTGVALPGMGNASQWLGQAQSYGYSTGLVPVAGSIAVYSGHVAYVAEVSDTGVYIIEGGYRGGYNERWVPYDSSGSQPLQGYIYTGASPVATGEANAPLFQSSSNGGETQRYNMNTAPQKAPIVEVRNVEGEGKVPALTPISERAEETIPVTVTVSEVPAPLVILRDTAPLVVLSAENAQ